MMSEISPWVFIIDTDSYAGNFEREMCAYSTGKVGECGVGENKAELFNAEMGITEEMDMMDAGPFGEHINCYQADEHGCGRPASIWHGPKAPYHYNSVAIYFHKEPTEAMIQIMKDRSLKYAEDNDIKVRGYRLLSQKVVTTEKSV